VPKRYFTYRFVHELRRDAARLGVELPLVEDREEIRRVLARPVKISQPAQASVSGPSWRAGNSLAIHPMEGCDGNPDGTPGELTFRRYKRFGESGAKLIWFEACAVVPEGRANPRQLWIHSGSAPAIAKLLEACRNAHREKFGSIDGLVAVLQLTHSGRYSFQKPVAAGRHPVLDRFPVVAPISAPPRESTPAVMTDEELVYLQDRFAEAAALAREIGFDGVDLKMTHGYLLSEILGARLRPGPYGGTLENRARMALETFAKIRRSAGEDFLLVARLGVYDGMPFAVAADGSSGVPREIPRPYPVGFGIRPEDPGQMDLEEPLRFAGWLRGAGVSLLNVSMGTPYSNPHVGRPFEKANEGSYETPEHPLLGVARHFRAAAEIQQAFPEVAVVGTGYSWLQHFLIHAAAANLKLGRVKLVGLGRAALAYPWLAADALERGELNPLQTCKTLSYCTFLMRSKKHPLGQFPTGCPPFDKNPYGEIVKQARHAAREP
jgi:2,4-dienoyl-CoA reductase-like NADH-dependent reductase (Old Yellow Enzyme family)